MPLTSWYDNWDENYFWDVAERGTTIQTSGSSGEPKSIFQPPAKIIANSHAAIEVQGFNRSSKVYTCLSPIRAGGLFAQTIPALMAYADVDLAPFSPYEYVRQAHKYTHTHLTPKQAKAVMLTKGFKTLDLTGKTFLVGSEPVTYDIIEAFVEKGARVILIWGMTEIGPNAIMHVFNNMDEVKALKEITPPNTTPLGNIFNCYYKIMDRNHLYVMGDLSVYDDWFDTKDLVVYKDGHLFYKGREGTFVDFNNPKKG